MHGKAWEARILPAVSGLQRGRRGRRIQYPLLSSCEQLIEVQHKICVIIVIFLFWQQGRFCVGASLQCLHHSSDWIICQASKALMGGTQHFTWKKIVMCLLKHWSHPHSYQ